LKQIFLISARAREGKDSTADIMMKYLDGKCIKVSFADYLKTIATKYFNWDGDKGEQGRTLLQYIGTDLIRDKIGWQNFHVNRVYEDIKIAENQFDYFLIPDTRRKNEIFYMKAMFPDLVTTIRVDRLNFESPLTKEQQIHISETDLDSFNFDFHIRSESGLDNLETEIKKVLFPRKHTTQPSEPDFDPPMRMR
jgi:hypothetical protein